MKPLIVLFTVFFLTLLGSKLLGDWNLAFAGNVAMSATLVLTGIGHFKFPKGMEMMMPPAIPQKQNLIYFTGILEFLAAAGLLIPALRHITAIFLIIFFVLLLPVNIYAAAKGVNLERGDYSGPGPGYLWFRVPLQVLFIAWVWWFSL